VGVVNPGPDVPRPYNSVALHSLQPGCKLTNSENTVCDGKSDDASHVLGAPPTTTGGVVGTAVMGSMRMTGLTPPGRPLFSPCPGYSVDHFLKLLENDSGFEVYIQISPNNLVQLDMVIIYEITRPSVSYLHLFENRGITWIVSGLAAHHPSVFCDGGLTG